jgi:hypothetical protein
MPVARKQLAKSRHRMRLDPEKHVPEILERVNAVGLARRDERIETGDVLAGFVVTDKEKILSTESHDAQGSL